MDSNSKNWITSSDLVQWAETKSKDCEQYLPFLIRLLIRETINGIKSMRFPSGDSTRYTGWDGVLETSNDLEMIPEFIPKGTSFWEIGTGIDCFTKAEADYKNRTENNKGYDLKTSTFVFITPRIWEDNSRKNAKIKKGKNDWIKRKTIEDDFNHVVVNDARDLEEWIQKCPHAAIWLGIHLKKYPSSGLESLSDFWERWVSNPKNKFAPEIVLSGRKRNLTELKKWFTGKYKPFTLKSLTREEAVAFLFATISTLPEEEKKYFLERCIIVKDIETFINFSKVYSNYILVNYFTDPSAADYAASNNNHVFIPVTPDNSTAIVNDELNTLGVYELLEELQKMGFDHDEAYQLSRDSGRSLSVLRSLLEFKQQPPEWAKSENTIFLLTALLMGSWDDSNEDDKSMVSYLSQNEYEEFKNKIIEFNKVEDPPVYIIGNMWGIRSQYYSWFILAGSLSKELLKRFFDVVNKVLFEIDPEYDLAEDERYKAQMLGVKRKYSGWFRGGLLNSLILLSIYGDKTQNRYIAAEVEKFINKLLLDADDKRWFSVANILPQLAEASPEAFLDNIEAALTKEDTSITVLFREGKNTFTSRCNHAGLLWALECLAWDTEYLTRVTLILGKLMTLKNKDSNWGNTPESSLRNIYLAWFPNTTADIEKRLMAINALIEQDKNVAFELLLKLMPVRGDVAHPTYKPHWRGFGENEKDKTNDTYKSLTEYFSTILKVAEFDGALLSKLIPFYDRLPYIGDRVKLYEHIKNNISEIKIGRNELREALRELIMEHKSFPTSDWALPEAVINSLKELFILFPPSDAKVEYKWLFDSYFPNIDVPKDNQTEYDLKLNQERLYAVRILFEKIGLDDLITFSCNVKEPFFLGDSLAQVNVVSEAQEEDILQLLEENRNKNLFARGYLNYKIHSIGKSWIHRVIEALKTNNAGDKIVFNFLILLKFEKDTWDYVSSFKDDIIKGYWQNWTGRIYNLSKKDSDYAYARLLENKRYVTVIDSLTLGTSGADNVSNELIVKVLKGAATEKPVEPFDIRFDSYRIAELFKILDKRGFDDVKSMGELEWLYAHILTDDIWHRPPKLLHKEMAENPKFYIEIIKMVFKPKNDIALEKEELKGFDEDSIKRRANIGWKLLRSFHTIPGSHNSSIDYEKLKKWIDAVIKISIENKRESIVKDKIGELLAYSEPIDNIWPPEPVCRIIEYLKNRYVDEAFYVCERNKQGTITKGIFEGGQQEQAMEAKYNEFARKINSKYIRTIKILKMIANSYHYDATAEDERAEQDKMKSF